MRGENWGAVLHNKATDDQWKIISGKITEAVNKYVPCKKIKTDDARRKTPTWMNGRVIKRIKMKRTAFEKYCQSKEGRDYLEYTKARNAAKTESRRAIREYEKEIAKQAKQNPKKFYQYVNSKLRTKSAIGDLKADNGNMVDDDTQKAAMFNSFFGTVFTRENLQNLPDVEKKRCQNELDSIEISESIVRDVLRKLHTDKSPGPDGIHPRVLKECADEISGALAILFQTSLSEGAVPQAWKEANVTPIYKKGSKDDVGNYRPVSLTSVVCKVMERIVRNALLKHMLDNKFLSDQQHGFVHGRSCTTQLLEVVDKWSEILDKVEQSTQYFWILPRHLIVFLIRD